MQRGRRTVVVRPDASALVTVVVMVGLRTGNTHARTCGLPHIRTWHGPHKRNASASRTSGMQTAS